MGFRFPWSFVEATELLEGLDDQRFDELVPATSGIYIWRKRFTATTPSRSTADGCRKWVEEVATLPAGRLGRSPLAHCVWSEGLQLGGGGLSEEKALTLDKLSEKRQMREYLIGFIESLSQFAQVLYVGRSDNLRRRTREHLTGITPFSKYVEETLGLAWSGVEFSCCALSQTDTPSADARAVQELLELLAQRALAPFGTERPG